MAAVVLIGIKDVYPMDGYVLNVLESKTGPVVPKRRRRVELRPLYGH